MLPRDIESFTGRQAELDRLTAAAAGFRGSGGVVRVFAVEGMGGIGKTALALRAAHQVAGWFPDGQLFIDLQGYTPGVRPVAPEDALRSLLFALGVAREQIPEGLAERAALYRGRLAETRTLVILDNAESLAQVEPLLPGTGGCLVLVTSRRALPGLDSQVMALDTLPPDEAAELFRAAAGPDRIAADDPQVAEIVELCGYLPLAIRVLAARLARRRALTAGDVLAELRTEHRRLGNLADDDRSVAAAFELLLPAPPVDRPADVRPARPRARGGLRPARGRQRRRRRGRGRRPGQPGRAARPQPALPARARPVPLPRPGAGLRAGEVGGARRGRA